MIHVCIHNWTLNVIYMMQKCHPHKQISINTILMEWWRSPTLLSISMNLRFLLAPTLIY